VNFGFVTVVYTFTTSGNYQFAVTIICGAAKSTHVFYDNLYIMSATGLADMNTASGTISLYPNPVTDVLNIILDGSSDNVTVNISNVAGQIISTINTVTDRNQKGFTINTSSLPQGLYFVQVNYAGKMITGRFIK
jgi:hypothetical protein